nr:aspartate/glutamate racemase family protein [Nocardioides luti]
MPTQPARILPVDTDRATPFGPAVIEHRTAQAGFSELGTYLMTFPDGGHSDPWTVQYEESIYVAAGEASLLVGAEAEESEILAKSGDLVALPKGTTVRYGGKPGTELVLSIAPVNWRDQETTRIGDEQDAAGRATGSRRLLFLTPFHFAKKEHDDHFDSVVTELIAPAVDDTVVADHVEYFESDGMDYDAAQTVAVVNAVQRANADGYDAVIIACHYDPAVADARLASKIPVIAPLQLTCGVAIQHGPRFAVITDIEEAETVIAGLVHAYGYGDACTGVTAIGREGDNILEDTLGAATAVDEVVARLAAEGDVQSIVIGCTIVSAAYETHRQVFPDRGIAVLNSNLLAVKGAALAAN